MSEDPSTINKDPNKVSKKKNSGTNSDFKQQQQPRKGSKDYQVVFEAKGSEKPSKEQSNTRKTSTSSANQDEHQAPKNSNKQKSHAKNRKESRDQGWKKKYPRVSKEVIIDFYLKAPAYTDIDELVSNCSQLFVKEKLIPVNKEDNQLDPNEGLILKNSYPPTAHNAGQGHSNANAHASTHTQEKQPTDVATGNVNTNNVKDTTTNASTIGFVRSTMPTAPSSTKPAEQSDAPVNLNDPIQAMRERMKRDKANKEKKEAAQKAENAAAEGKSKEENTGEVRKESQEEARINTEEKENKNINSQEVPSQTQKEILKEDNTKTALGESQAEKERKEDSGALQAQNESRSPSKDSSVDLSKLSFDENKGGQDFNSQQALAQQRAYQENANQYGNQEMNQNNVYRGQQIQQINTQYANKGNMQEQASPSMRRDSPGSQTNIPKVLPSSIVFKYFSPDYDDKIWSYIDLEGKLQGPFTGRTMDDWYSKGYLPVELNVTVGKGNGYKGLKDLIEIIANHNAQAGSPMAKTQTPPKMQQAQDYQYQQQQQQQQYPQQYQQQQQQYPQQYQQQQQTQQQRQYQQYQQQHQQQYPQQQAQYTQQQKAYYQQQQQQDPRNYQEYAQYGSTPTSAGRNKAMEGFDSSNQYYGNQGGSNQYGSQGNVIYGKVQEINPQSQTYYSDTQYYNQESTPKSSGAYGNYKQGANVNANQNAYYQDPNTYSGYNQQQAYNQPQKQQVKANYPTQMQQQQNYQTGGNQMGGYGGNYGGQSQGRDYSNYGGNGGNMNNAQMYSMQQQQQMMNKGAGMGGMGANSGMSSDYLKSMLGMARPSSRQEGHEY